jgi:tetratricopeptide (TPR) repeat protein
MPAAALGGRNPLPALGAWGCMPHGEQNGYDRVREPRAFRVAVMENDRLRATFLLELGGRLWSLIDKRTGRELLYVNPVFQPGALACCNAWFSGGVEWNFCTGGHTPLTCSPLFAARVRGAGGAPVLRLYEFERRLAMPYQMDFHLPDGSPWLFVRVRLVNPHDHELQTYWWSNIAVPESPDVRVLAPADAALKWDYKSAIKRLSMPHDDGKRDASYPVNLPGSADYFWDIPVGQRPWEASLDGEGRGLIHVSTSALRGRKMFVWGMSPGGRHWQQFLSVPGKPYIEIQGGTAQTQQQKCPLAARGAIEWMEAYGLMESDPRRVHGSDWDAAWRSVDAEIERALPAARMEGLLAGTAEDADRAPAEILHRGSGWGALENERRLRFGLPPAHGAALVFDASTLGPEQEPWLTLLGEGSLPEADAPVSWMVQTEWQALLEAAPRHWLVLIHLGVMRFQAGDVAGACGAWEESLALRRSPWALRNLAIALRREKQADRAAELLMEAYGMRPDLWPLAAECGRALIDAGRSADLLGLLGRMPAAVRQAGRIRVLEAWAASHSGDLARAEEILLDPELVMPDLHEGELMLSDIWYGLQAQKLAAAAGVPVDDALRERARRDFPPPANLDFRMASVPA